MRSKRTTPTGIRARHSRTCGVVEGGRCNCRPSYEAFVFSQRDGRKIRKTFQTLAAAKAWRADRTLGPQPRPAPGPDTDHRARGREGVARGRRGRGVRDGHGASTIQNPSTRSGRSSVTRSAGSRWPSTRAPTSMCRSRPAAAADRLARGGRGRCSTRFRWRAGRSGRLRCTPARVAASCAGCAGRTRTRRRASCTCAARGTRWRGRSLGRAPRRTAPSRSSALAPLLAQHKPVSGRGGEDLVLGYPVQAIRLRTFPPAGSRERSARSRRCHERRQPAPRLSWKRSAFTFRVAFGGKALDN